MLSIESVGYRSFDRSALEVRAIKLVETFCFKSARLQLSSSFSSLMPTSLAFNLFFSLDSTTDSIQVNWLAGWLAHHHSCSQALTAHFKSVQDLDVFSLFFLFFSFDWHLISLVFLICCYPYLLSLAQLILPRQDAIDGCGWRQRK